MGTACTHTPPTQCHPLHPCFDLVSLGHCDPGRRYWINSIWWHFLNPATLGISSMAIGMLLFVCVMVPVATTAVTCYLNTKGDPLRRLLSARAWMLMGLIPAGCILITIGRNSDVSPACVEVSCTHQPSDDSP
jgi:hypothetical protein